MGCLFSVNVGCSPPVLPMGCAYFHSSAGLMVLLRIVINISTKRIFPIMLSKFFWGELIDKFITIDTKVLNKYIVNYCDVIHSIFSSVCG